MGFYVNLWSPFLIVGVMLFFNGIAQYLLFSSSFANNESLSDKLHREANEAQNSQMSIDRYGTSSQLSVKGSVKSPKSILELLQMRRIIALSFIAIAANATIGMIEPLVPIFLRDEFDQNILWQGIYIMPSISYDIFLLLCHMIR